MHAFSKNLGIAFLAPSLVAASMQDLLSKRDATTYEINAVCTSDQLLRYYGTTNAGLFENLWWQSGNFISALATFFKLDPDYGAIHEGIFAKTFAEAPGYGNYKNFLDAYYDDEGWWGNAFLDVYDYTDNSTYLNQAAIIFNDIVNGLGTPCGGIWWDKSQTYVASIANGLYIELAAGLANRVPEYSTTYLDYAEQGWNWFFSAGLITSDYMVQDGLDKTTCKPSTDIFTYNQGVILGAAAELYKATRNETFLTQAAALANASTKSGSDITNSNGILTEGCDKTESCDSTAQMFKGAYIRGLRKLQLVDPKSNWLSFLETNAQSIWDHDLSVQEVNGESECIVGSSWAGPFNSSQADVVTQGAALDALNAALAATQ